MDRQSGNLPVEDILEAIKRACTKVGLQAHRVDEVEHSGAISAKILDEIKSQRFLISDLTHQRPNVYYEIGYAHGLGKEVILAAQKGTEVHFDIAHLNVIVYNTLKELEDRIVKRLLAKMTAKERQNI
jgi:nucleoside 2-deoxyribosyltransferase